MPKMRRTRGGGGGRSRPSSHPQYRSHRSAFGSRCSSAVTRGCATPNAWAPVSALPPPQWGCLPPPECRAAHAADAEAASTGVLPRGVTLQAAGRINHFVSIYIHVFHRKCWGRAVAAEWHLNRCMQRSWRDVHGCACCKDTSVSYDMSVLREIRALICNNALVPCWLAYHAVPRRCNLHDAAAPLQDGSGSRM